MVALGILVPSVSVRIAAVQQRKLPFEGAFFVERALRALPLTLPLPKPLPRGGAPPQKRRVRLRLMNKLHAAEGTCAQTLRSLRSLRPSQTRADALIGPLPLTWPRVAMGLRHTCLPLHHQHAGRTEFPGFWSSRSAGFPWPGPFCPFLVLAGQTCPILSPSRWAAAGPLGPFTEPGGPVRSRPSSLSRAGGALLIPF